MQNEKTHIAFHYNTEQKHSKETADALQNSHSS